MSDRAAISRQCFRRLEHRSAKLRSLRELLVEGRRGSLPGCPAGRGGG
ncbi:type II toxin-antitoxin system ParD family antitoxin [Streptomyces sp. NPDC085929]